MTDARPLIADELDGAPAPCVTSSFQAECVVLVHMLREVRPGHPGAVPGYRPSLRRDLRVSRRAGGAVGIEPREPAGGRAEPGPVAAGAPRRAARATRWSRSSARSRATTSGSPALRRDQSPSRANLGEVEPFPLPDGKILRKVSPLAAWTMADVLGVRAARTTSRCCRSTIRATPASAASRARRCRSIRRTTRSGRWQGQKLECGIHLKPVASGSGHERDGGVSPDAD